jgi:hypothetical protein
MSRGEIVSQLMDYIEVNYLIKKPVHLFEGSLVLCTTERLTNAVKTRAD